MDESIPEERKTQSLLGPSGDSLNNLQSLNLICYSLDRKKLLVAAPVVIKIQSVKVALADVPRMWFASSRPAKKFNIERVPVRYPSFVDTLS
jgi:hypothetical protein